MLQILCLIVLFSAASALKKPLHGFHNVKQELLQVSADNGNLAESLIDIILDQGNIIKAMEKKMNTMESKMNTMERKVNTITETDHRKGEQIIAMQERIADLETIIEKQNQDLAEKDMFIDTIGRSQKADIMARIETDMMPNIATVQKEEKKTLIKDQKAKTGRVQKRAGTNVAFSTWLSQKMNHLSVGHIIKPDQIFINDGNGYNKHTGVFTVPTSGVYLLTYCIDNLGSKPLVVELKVDSINMGNLRAFSQFEMASKSIIARLVAGQAVWLETAYFPDASVDTSTFDKFTTFSGALLY